MPRKRNGADDAVGADPMDKIAALLAVFAMKDVPQDAAAIRLENLGFSPREIGGILGVGDNYVHMIKSRRKSVGRKKRKQAKS